MSKVSLYVSELNLRGGTHKQVFQFVSVANALGVDADVITPIFDPKKTFEGFQEYKVSFIFRRFLFSNISPLMRIQHMFAQILCGIRFDASRKCFIHDNKCYIFISILLLRGIPYTWQVNDPDSSFASGINSRRKIRFARLRKYLATQFLRRADSVLVNVTKNKKVIFDNTGVEPTVFYCGVERTKFHSRPTQISRVCTGGHLNILSIGVVQPHRNYVRLIRALDLVREANSLTLNIVGSTISDTSYSSKVGEVAAQSKIEVKLLGNISEEELGCLFVACDVFVFVNEDQSWGLSIFEAISNSKPVLISKSVGALELLSEVSTVFAVDEKSEVEIASGMDRLIVEMRENPTINLEHAANKVNEMSWEKMYVQPVLKFLDLIHA